MVSRGVNDRISRERSKDLRSLRWVGSYKPLRHHADYSKRRVGDRQLSPHNVRCAMEPALPETLADHDRKSYRTTAMPVILGRQIASQQRRRFERLKELPAYQHPADVFVAGAAPHLQRIRVEREDACEQIVPAFQAAKVGRAEAVVGLPATLVDT